LAAVLLTLTALLQGPVARLLVGQWLSWWGWQAGGEIRAGQVRGDFFRPLVLGEVEFTAPDGTRLTVGEAQISLAGPRAWWTKSFRLVDRVSLRGVRGRMVPSRADESSSGPARGRWFSWPAVPGPSAVTVEEADVEMAGRGWSVAVRGAELVLDEERPGVLRVPAAELRVGGWRREFSDLHAPTAWREGTVYVADLALAEQATVDALSWRPGRAPAAALEARAFGGYLYADWSRAEQTKAALYVLNLSLEEARVFAGMDGQAAGTLDVGKLTFNGDPSNPWSGQLAVRVEAREFAWRDTALEELTVGLSVSGRRVRLNEAVLRQEVNTLSLRGTATLPTDRLGWREIPFEFETSAEVRDLRALGRLFGPPWDELSGGFTLAGRGSGCPSDGEGWLQLRGWDLRARGMPAGSLQADFQLEGRDLKLVALEAQSGVNFARGHGRVALDDSLTYAGRLELRVREVARYLEPLGRRAPDWAREGGVLFFWDGDGTARSHSGVATVELVKFSGDLNPVPVNAKLAASYSPGNIYVSRFLLDRGALSLSSTLYFGAKGLSVQGLQLFDGRTRLLRGELFLPLSLGAVLARRPWPETVMADGGVYAFLRSDDLELGSLVQLFGQDTKLRGRADLRLDAQGPWGEAKVDGRLVLSGWRADFPLLRIPNSRANVNFQIQDRRASVAAAWQPGGGRPLRLEMKLPMFGETAAGQWTLLDAAGPWEAELEIPPTDLAPFAPRVAGMRATAGSLQAELRGSGTTARPQLDGTVEWKNGRVEWAPSWSALEQFEGRAVFAGTGAVLEETRGVLGGGTVGLAGGVEFSDRRNLAWELLLRAREARIYADENVRVQGAIDLEARGGRDGGGIRGKVGLDGSAVLRDIVVTPQLGAVRGPQVSAPFRLTGGPWRDWALDVTMRASRALPVGRGGEAGAVVPELSLRGTPSEPLLLGTVRVERLAVGFPARGHADLSGAVHFTRGMPWMPVLDLTGRGEAGPYDLRAGAFGPLGERRLLVSASPPLTAEQIVLLLNTGVAPVPAAASEVAPRTPEEKMQEDPSWFDLGRIRGLLGRDPDSGDGAAGPWRIGEDALAYEWGWR